MSSSIARLEACLDVRSRRASGARLTPAQVLDIPPELSRFVDPDADGEMEVDAPLSPVEAMVTPVRALAPVVWPAQELFPRDKFLRLASKSAARGLLQHC